MNIKLKKTKVDFKIFNSFLVSLGVILFLLSFAFDNVLNTLLCVAALILIMLPRCKFMLSGIKSRKYFNIDLMCMAAFVYLLFAQRSTASLWGAILYSCVATAMDTVFNAESELLELHEEIKEKKYHKIVNRNSEIVNSLDIFGGDFVELFSGEVMPVDGVIKAGTGTMSTMNVSGDSQSVTVAKGMEVLAGYTLLSGHIIIEAQTSALDSKLSKSVEKTKGATVGKTAFESTVLMAANILSVVLLVALSAFCIFKFANNVNDWKYVTYTLPVVFVFTASCGFQSIVPSGYKTAILRAARKGIVISKNKFIEKTMFVKNVAFFTKGVITNRYPSIKAVYAGEKTTKEELVMFVAYSQYKLNPGILNACVNFLGKNIDKRQIKNYMRIGDNTAIIKMQDIEVLSGTSDSFLKVGLRTDVPNDVNKICVAVNGDYIGYVEFEHSVKEGAKQAVDMLKHFGIKKTAVLSVESQKTADAAAISCGISSAFGDLRKEEIKEHVDNFGKKWLVLADGIDPELLTASPVITYDYKPDLRFEANFTVDDLSAAAQYLGILSNTKALMLINFIAEFVLKIILLVMILKGTSAVWLAVLLSLGFKLLQKITNYRILNKN